MSTHSEAMGQQVHGKLQPMQARRLRLVDRYRSMQTEAREPVTLTDDPNGKCSHLAERQPNLWLGFALIAVAAAVLFAGLIMLPADGTTSADVGVVGGKGGA